MSEKRGYQLHFSRGDSILKDVNGRTQKFKKILSVIHDFQPDTCSSNCLDIGCSGGIVASLLAEHFSMVVGIDIDQEALQFARDRYRSPGLHFLTADAMALSLKDNSVDVVVCNHIYEHVPDASRMMEETHRVLKKDGFCYFAAGNRHVLMEGHYHLPLLSWLPKPLAHLYLKLTGKGDFYYEEHLSLRGLRQLVQKFHIHDYTLSVIREPEKFCATEFFNQAKRSYKWFQWVAPYFYWWIPTYIWVLTKK